MLLKKRAESGNGFLFGNFIEICHWTELGERDWIKRMTPVFFCLFACGTLLQMVITLLIGDGTFNYGCAIFVCFFRKICRKNGKIRR